MASTSSPNIAPASGVPNTEAKPALIPAIRTMRRSAWRSAEDVRQLVGQRAAHLHRRPFAANRSAKPVRDHGADQHQRRHPRTTFGVVDFVDQQVIPRLHAAAI
jgi:hypothetical protein